LKKNKIVLAAKYTLKLGSTNIYRIIVSSTISIELS